MIRETQQYINLLSGYDRKIIELVNAGDFEKARWVAEESYEYSRLKFGEEHLETAKTLNNLAWIYDLHGHYQAAEILYKRSIFLKRHACGKNSVELISTLENLASLYQKNCKYEEAVKILYEMIEIVRSNREPWSFREAVYLTQLAEINVKLNRMSKAEGLYHQSLAFVERMMPTDHPNIGRAFANIADFYRTTNNYQRAEFYYKRAYAVLSKALPGKHTEIQEVMDKLMDMQSFLTDTPANSQSK